MECGSVSDFSEFSEPTASSFQNSLTGNLAASSSQNSLTGSLVASSSQNSMTGGCGSGESDLTVVETEGSPGTDLSGGEAAGFSQNQLVSEGSSLVCLKEDDVPGASLHGRDPSQLHVVELKRWLKCRGATTSGRKKDLVKRVKDYISTGLDSKIVDPDGGVHANRVRAQSEKNKLIALPSPLPSQGWTSSLSQIPPFSYSCLYAHLVSDSPTIANNQRATADIAFRAGAMKHKEEGYRLFRDNHVMMVRFHPGDQYDYCLFHAFVKPSFKFTGKYNTIVSIAKASGFVVGAQCNCKAGAGGCCKHVAALLYNILDYVELGLKEIPADKTCTEQPQQWHKPKNDVCSGPALFSDIPFVHHSYGKRKAEDVTARMENIKKFRACPSSFSTITEDQLKKFCTSLETKKNSNLFTSVMQSNNYKPLPAPSVPQTTNVTNSSLVLPSPKLTPEDFIKKKLEVDSKQAANIEQMTRGQANSPIWFQERALRITSSFFGRVCKRLVTTSPDCLVHTIINQRMYHSIPTACAWGKENESKAVNAYKVLMHEAGHTDLVVRESGLFINPRYVYLGASPDGILDDPTSSDPNGLLEVKCPYQQRNISPHEAARQTSFFCEIKNGVLVLKKRHNYYYQVQGQMAICSRKWCDFVVYTNAGTSIERIDFDECFWKEAVSKLKEFYYNFIMPKLMDKHA